MCSYVALCLFEPSQTSAEEPRPLINSDECMKIVRPDPLLLSEGFYLTLQGILPCDVSCLKSHALLSPYFLYHLHLCLYISSLSCAHMRSKYYPSIQIDFPLLFLFFSVSVGKIKLQEHTII